jgi:hypothetical protein
MGEMRNTNRILFEKNESKASFGIPRQKWEKIRWWILYAYSGGVWSGVTLNAERLIKTSRSKPRKN